ncbi:hypothetical protein [Brucella pituitosa]|uniref:hypothetical protein n=1 Tax=Brucella pituitosa TaxID=571256 RepID=UPI003F4A9CDC
MRAFGLIVLLGCAVCAWPSVGQESNATRSNSGEGASEHSAPSGAVGGPFAGVWASCDSKDSPDECSRYLLIQSGDRICGTWSYFASGQAFEGRVVAHASSKTKARRTLICGRPGSETDTECAEGWQQIDKPLELCDGKLSDMARANGACFADYEAVPASQTELAELEVQPWLKSCLATRP